MSEQKCDICGKPATNMKIGTCCEITSEGTKYYPDPEAISRGCEEHNVNKRDKK